MTSCRPAFLSLFRGGPGEGVERGSEQVGSKRAASGAGVKARDTGPCSSTWMRARKRSMRDRFAPPAALSTPEDGTHRPLTPSGTSLRTATYSTNSTRMFLFCSNKSRGQSQDGSSFVGFYCNPSSRSERSSARYAGHSPVVALSRLQPTRTSTRHSDSGTGAVISGILTSGVLSVFRQPMLNLPRGRERYFFCRARLRPATLKS